MGKIISSMLIGASFITEPLEAMRNSLVEILGFNIEMWQMILVGVLALALIVVLIVALCRPGKNKKERIKQFIDTEEKICKIKKALNEKNEEIGKTRHVLNKRQLDYNRSVRTVKENYAETYGKEDREFFVASEKLNELNENLRDLSLRMTKKNIKADELENLKAEFAKVEAEHSELAERFSEMRTEKIVRDEKYNAELKKLEDEFAFVKDDYEADIAVKTKEIKKLEAELDKLEHTKIKISSREADEILEEFRKQEELEKDARLRLAEDDVEKAKNEYIEAQNLRIQYERDRIEAVNSAKEDSAARRQTLEATRAATEARVKYGAPSAANMSDEETEEVKETIKASDDERIASEYIDSVIKESESIDDDAERAKPEVTVSGTTEEVSAPETTTTLTENAQTETATALTEELKPEEETVISEEQHEEESVISEEQAEEESAITEDVQSEETTPESATDALDNLERGMSMIDEHNHKEVISEVATVEKEAEEATADAAATESDEHVSEEPVEESDKHASEEPAEDSAEEESEEVAEATEEAAIENDATEETKEEVADETANEAEEPTVSEAEDQTTEQTEDIASEADNEVSAEGLNLANEAENIADEETNEESVSAEDTEKAEIAPEAQEVNDATETTEITENQVTEVTEEPTVAENEVAATEDVAAEDPAEEVSEEVKVATTETTDENVAAVSEEPADNTANDAKIIRMPKIIHNDGIPATPIHKKSKFSKPVTKIVVKKAPVKDEAAEELPVKEEAKKSAYLGKWKTETTEDGKICAKLCASNGGVLLVTPSYTSDIGLKNGIASIKKHLAAGNVAITANKAGKFVFKVSAPSGRTIVTSEQYGARFQCEKALESAKRFAETAVVSEQ